MSDSNTKETEKSNTAKYMRDIVVAVISVVITILLGKGLGIFEYKLSESQLNTVARSIVDDKDKRDVLITYMKSDGSFKGDKGAKGDKGNRGEDANPEEVASVLLSPVAENLRNELIQNEASFEETKDLTYLVKMIRDKGVGNASHPWMSCVENKYLGKSEREQVDYKKGCRFE